tara:strand:- start:20375 stop:20635 length:261 start_codon:yes stop_codon:yes gene_type:complete
MAQGHTAYSLTGGQGSVFINDTAAHTEGTFMAIQAVGDAAAAINNSGTTSNITDFDANITISAGQTIYGTFESITLASGAVIAYFR